MNRSQWCVLSAMVARKQHINVYKDRCVLSVTGELVDVYDASALEEEGYVAMVRPGNYDLTDKGRQAGSKAPYV